MTSESVQSWLDRTLKTGAKLGDFIQSQKLDDTFDWGAMFSCRLRKQRPVRAGGILLTGPDGCGKHTASGHMIQLLFLEGFDCVFLDGRELGSYGIEQGKERLDALFEYFYDHGKGLCMSLQNMEDCPCRQELLSYLGQTLNDYILFQDELTPFFLILIDQKENEIPALLRGRLQLCRMSLPDQKRRRIFFKNNAKGFHKYVSADVFVSATEGFTYAQLRDLADHIEDLIDVRDEVLSEEDFLAFAAEQAPEPQSEDILKKLAQSAHLLMETLPQMLKDAAAAARVAVPAADGARQPQAAAPQASAVPLNQADYISKKQEETENMRVNLLAEEVFGVNGVSELIGMYESR